MIIDHLSNASFYRSVHTGLATALDWLRDTDVARLSPGKIVINDDVFALVQEYTTKPPARGKFEAHQEYWDVQYVTSGEERMGWLNLSEATLSEPHSAERDIAFFTGAGSFVRVPAGSFAIFFPQDVHMPGVSLNDEPGIETVHKIVLKVRGR